MSEFPTWADIEAKRQAAIQAEKDKSKAKEATRTLARRKNGLAKGGTRAVVTTTKPPSWNMTAPEGWDQSEWVKHVKDNHINFNHRPMCKESCGFRLMDDVHQGAFK